MKILTSTRQNELIKKILKLQDCIDYIDNKQKWSEATDTLEELSKDVLSIKNRLKLVEEMGGVLNDTIRKDTKCF